MKKIPQPRFMNRHPYLFSVLILLMVVAAYMVAGTVVSLLKMDTFSIYLYGNLILTALTLLLLTGMHMWRETGLVRAPTRRSDLWVFALAFLPLLVNLAFGIKAQTLSSILIWLGLAITVGIVEEGLFRGLILQALIPKGCWKAVILSAVLFGLAHSLNVLAGSSPLYVLLQIGYALAIGFCWAAMVLRTGLLWPLVIAHFLIDFAGFIAADRIGASAIDPITIGVSVGYILLYTLFGIYLMRGEKYSEVKPVHAFGR